MSKYRVIPMQCGDNESYALLFYEADGAVMVDIHDSGTRALVQTLKTPFPVGGISTIRSIQSFDVMFFAQPDTRPCKLSRKNKKGGAEGEYEFSFEDNEFLPEPVMDWETGSDKTISVFAIPDEDLLKTASDGTRYYPANVLREAMNYETLALSFAYCTWRDSGKTSVDYIGIAYTGNTDSYSVGDVFSIGGLTVRGQWLQNGSVGLAPVADSVCDVDGTPASYSQHFIAGIYPGSTAGNFIGVEYKITFKFAKVLKVVEGECVYFLLGYGPVNSFDEVNNPVSENPVSFNGAYSYSDFYVTSRSVPEGTSVLDANYHNPVTGSGFLLGMTIDGSNTNENMHVGQIVALKYKSRINETRLWDYDSLPAGTISTSNPPVISEEKLPSKKDWAGSELRPVNGGGFKESSDLFPVRGKVNLRSEGKWSGIIELQEIDKNKNVTTIARITSENALSNTDLSRDITEFGSSVRVVCTRREYAYEVNRSIKSDGGVVEKVLKSDDGCQWTLTSDDVQTAYLKVLGKKSLSDGRHCYTVETIGCVNRSFSTNSYALGAWCKENGYPRHIGIYQERLVYAGNKTKPTTVWMSKTNSWDDFELGTEASSAITATLATDKYDEIKWLLPNKNGITIGTRYNEFSLGANDGAVTTADNVIATITSNIGSSEIYADTFGTAMIMVKTGRKELYRIDYNTLSEEAAGNQISLLASHLFENDPVVDMFSIKAPSNMLFCLHESGKLSSLTYEPDYGVNGWARHEILDGIDSGCVFRRGGKDVLALVVRDGESYVLGELDLSSDVWTDDGKSYESSAVTTPLVFDGNRGGYGKQTIISGCDVYVGEESKRFNVRLNGGDWVRVDRGFDEKNEPRAFEHMRVEIPANSGWVDEATVEIRSDAPYPLVVRAIGASGNG